MKLMEAYLVLNLPEGATEAEVREAHREMSRLVHPDKHGGDERLRLRAEGMQKRLNEARKVIQEAGYPVSPSTRRPAGPPQPHPPPPRNQGPSDNNGTRGPRQEDKRSSTSDRKRSPRPPDIDAIPEGQLIGPYKVIHRLARGSSTSIFRVEHTTFGNILALKVLRDETPVAEQRFFTATRIMARMQHRNVVDVLDVLSEDGLLAIVLEYIPGVPLDQWWSLPLPVERSISTFMQICEGLASLHQHRVAHLSLKPGHVLVYPDRAGADCPKIIDFAAARELKPNLRMHDVYTPTTCSPQYMSPEQAADFVMDARSDIYSLGALMFECFSGEPMFTATTIDDYRHLHQSVRPSSPRRGPKGRAMDPALEAIIIKCVEKSPERRFQSALDLRDALAATLLARADRNSSRAAPDSERSATAPNAEQDRGPPAAAPEPPPTAPSPSVTPTASSGSSIMWPAFGLLVWVGIFALLVWQKRGCDRDGNSSAVARPSTKNTAMNVDAGPHFSCLKIPFDGARLCAGPGYIPRMAGPNDVRQAQSAWCVENRVSWADARTVMVCVVTKQECEEHLLLSGNGKRSLFNRKECHAISPSEWFGEPVAWAGRPDAFVCKDGGACQAVPGDLITVEETRADAWCYSSPKEPDALLSCFPTKKACNASRKARPDRDPCVLEGPQRSLQSYATLLER